MINRKPLYTCECCGHEKQRKNNFLTKTLWCFKSLGRVFIWTMFLFGFFAFINFVNVGIYSNPDALISIGSTYASINNLFGGYRYKDEISQLNPFALNLTKDCNDDECRAKVMYNHLLTFDYKYENATDINPLKIWNAKEGDCDQMSFLLLDMLKEIEIKANLLCSTTHCFTIIEFHNKKIKADITKHVWEEI